MSFFIMLGALDIMQQVAIFVPSGRFISIILHVTVKGLLNVSLDPPSLSCMDKTL